MAWISILCLLCGISYGFAQYYSNEFAVHVVGGPEKARQLAKRHSLDFVGQIGSLEDYYLLKAPRINKRSLSDAPETHQALKDDPDVVWSEQQVSKVRVKRDFADSDDRTDWGSSFYGDKSNMLFQDPYYRQQWYLHKGGRGGFDMNVEKVWKRNYTGRGVAVSILDDGVQPNHPDLAANYYQPASLDINGNDDDPTPQDNGDNKHGTRCAGEVAAVAGNEWCGVGVAYNAWIGGVRMLDGEVHDSVEARALSLHPQQVHIYSASWGPNDDGQTVDGPGPLAKKAFENGIANGRGGLGSVFVWASGNGGKSHDSCSCDGYTNSIWTISISSAAEDGSEPWYLEECPSTLATTYSSGNSLQRSIVTTDLYAPNNQMQACTVKHTGTSAAAPLAAGIIALALEANPRLNWRDLQYLTILSARPEPLIEQQWVTNSLGRKVSNKFGYGLMDADKMVQLAEKWVTVPEQHVCYSQKTVQQTAIVKGHLSVEVTTDGCQNGGNAVKFLEHVQVVLSIQSLHRGGLTIRVTSPAGTSSILLPPRPLDNSREGFSDWPFMSVQFWGENPAGTWKIDIMDASVAVGTPTSYLVAWSIVMYGVDKDPLAMQNLQNNRVASSSAVTCDISCKTCHGPHPDECDSCSPGQYFHFSHCLPKCPTGFFGNNRTFQCVACPPKCTICSSPDVCTACLPNHHLEKGKCVMDPSTNADCEKRNEYFDHRAGDHKCRPCHESCAACSGPKETDCIACKPPSVLYGTCVNSCPTNFTDVDGVCQVVVKGGLMDFAHWTPSQKYVLAAIFACTVIVFIGCGVFCCLQKVSADRAPTPSRGRLFKENVRYEKVVPVDESDEEVETFSKANYVNGNAMVVAEA